MIAFTGYKWNDAEDPASGEISLKEGGESRLTRIAAKRRELRQFVLSNVPANKPTRIFAHSQNLF